MLNHRAHKDYRTAAQASVKSDKPDRAIARLIAPGLR